MSQTVSLQDVAHVATLAHLELSAEEAPRMVRDLNAILDHFAQLQALDTTGVAPMAQVGDVLGAAETHSGEALRPDALKASLDRTAVMAEAPETDGRFFKVPKVIER
jgi:aspartyl-tRNA(Asn)/glutamyl-tRNA(Gln) amidotransferase subunit C